MGAKNAKGLKLFDKPEDRKMIDATFAKYDTNGDGKLSCQVYGEFDKFIADLFDYMVKTNPDVPVSDTGIALNAKYKTLSDVGEAIPWG